jgi:hypothetical protein
MSYSKSFLRIEYYSIWLIANFIICLLPLLITFIVTSDVTKIMASYIAFIFTRIVGSLYVFHTKNFEVKLDKLIFWITLLYTLISLACLPLYMNVEKISIFLNSISFRFIIVSFLLTLLGCFILNFQLLENKVLDQYNSFLLKTNAKRTAEKFQDFKTIIENS